MRLRRQKKGNTNKRRKEVRVLQEMQLLQVAAMNYRLRPLEKFVTYFPRMEQLSDKESCLTVLQLQAVLPAGARITVGQ
nr:ral-GDS-related protein-like isoform X3 [Chlorocebus sabaeus]